MGPYDPRSGMPPPRWPPADPSNGGVAGFAEALTAYYQVFFFALCMCQARMYWCSINV